MLRRYRILFCLLAFTIAVLTLPAANAQKGPEIIELFNGKDLTGWTYKKGPAFDGKIEASDGRYSAKDGVIIVHPGKDAKKKNDTKEMWTVRQFPKDFELRLEFRASVNADSGLFIRGPQLQV